MSYKASFLKLHCFIKKVILLFYEDVVISVQIFLNAREGVGAGWGEMFINFWTSQGKNVLHNS